MYAPPTKVEIRRILAQLKLTGVQAAKKAGLQGANGARQVRRYTGGYSSMPFTTLYVLIHRATGIVIVEDRWRDQLFVGNE